MDYNRSAAKAAEEAAVSAYNDIIIAEGGQPIEAHSIICALIGHSFTSPTACNCVRCAFRRC